MGIFNAIKEKILRYIDVNIKLIRINLIGRSADLLSYVIYGMIVLFIAFCIILFIGMGLTELFISCGICKLASIFITAGIYLVLLFIVLACRKPISRFLAGDIISRLTEDDEEGKKKKEKE